LAVTIDQHTVVVF